MFSFYEIWREDKAQLPILFIKFVNFHLRIRTGCIFRLNNVESCPNIVYYTQYVEEILY